MNRLLPTRRLVPRWRNSTFAVHQPDMLGLVKPMARPAAFGADVDEVHRAMAAWKSSQAIGDLADVLSYGVDPKQRSLLMEPANAALRHPGATPTMRLVAQEVLHEGSSVAEVWRTAPEAEGIRHMRGLLRIAPNDVVALVDLAQHHLAVGKPKSAYRALATANQLSPNSVHVIRALTRYWIHLEQPDRAHAFIKSTAMLSVDPWLMASEIATAQVAKVSSVQLRRAQRALAVKSFKPSEVGELAGAVGGMELYHGNFKEARSLFRLALENPNDNVLAQAITNQEFIGIEVDEQIMKRAPNGLFEGRALKAMLATDFEAAARFTACWSAEEPFSSRPRLLQSFVCGALGEFETALEAADGGLVSDPTDLSLRGNRAYALAALGRLSEAELELRALESKDDVDQRPFTWATRGMVKLLTGDSASGLKLYEAALEEFTRRKQEDFGTTCLAFMARTAAVAGIEQRDRILQRTVERYSRFPSHAAAVILKTLKQSVGAVGSAPLRRVVQWEWDSQSNSLVERRELTRRGASSVVVATRKRST